MPLAIRKLTDPPRPGWVKIRVRSNGGDMGDTEVLAYDSAGNEYPIENVRGVSWSVNAGEVATGRLEIVAPEVDVEAQHLEAAIRIVPSDGKLGPRPGHDYCCGTLYRGCAPSCPAAAWDRVNAGPPCCSECCEDATHLYPSGREHPELEPRCEAHGSHPDDEFRKPLPENA